MLKRFSLNYALFSLFMDATWIVGAFLFAVYLRKTLPYGLITPLHPDGIPRPSFYPIAICLWVGVAFAVSLYDPRKIYKAVDEYQALTLAAGFFSLAVAGVLYFTYRDTSRLLVAYALATTWLVLILWRMIARLVFRIQNRRRPRLNRVLILGAGKVGQQVAAAIREYDWTGLNLVGYLDDDPAKQGDGVAVLGRLDDIRRVVETEHINDVVLALPRRAHERINMIVAMVHDMPVNVRIIPDYFSLALYRATADDFGGIPMINLRDPALNDYQRMIKRTFDVVVGGLLTLLLLPLMGIIALAIKLDSPGPVLFRQKRMGENWRLFDMFKFRSMVVGAEHMQAQINVTDERGNIIHKRKDDPRVTRVGRFIRRWSMDELPQFFNVLKGDLSLVGPRPELPWLVERYQPWQRKRFAVPQGITGWWQVNGRSDNLMHLHTDEDLYYIQNYSLWLDIYILIKTPWVILRGRGAY